MSNTIRNKKVPNKNSICCVEYLQVPKTLTRQIAPGPVLGGLPKSMGAHQITQLNQAALHKKGKSVPGLLRRAQDLMESLVTQI
jgi:hypothetical protein